MLSRVSTVSLIGLTARKVIVEVDLGFGLPSFTLVGLGSTSILEARQRVRSAIRNSGLTFPAHRITVNLAPAAIRKDGSQYDLPMAVAILLANNQLPPQPITRYFFGELSLSGVTRRTTGVLAAISDALSIGATELFVPLANAPEATLVSQSIPVYPVQSLRQLVNHLTGQSLITPLSPSLLPLVESQKPTVDFSEIIGLSQVKRVLEIAAAGGHNLLLSGPPGTGKTLAARSLAGILPEQSAEELVMVTRIYSVAGLLNEELPVVSNRPFRSPHHTASVSAIIGGGALVKPGELSLAHTGVLFLDEVAEFSTQTLEALRQPLEDRQVFIARTGGAISYPASVILVATCNPCPCGYFGTATPCLCERPQLLRYRRRLSGPIIDRLDLSISVPPVEADQYTKQNQSESSATVRKRVTEARLRQHTRTKIGKNNPSKYPLDVNARTFLKEAVIRFSLSGRGYFRLLEVSRTIADLRKSDKIEVADLAEACQYRFNRHDY